VFRRKALVAKFEGELGETWTPWDFKRDSEIRILLDAKEGLELFREWHGMLHPLSKEDMRVD
jgi:hypothetical protein